MVAIRVGVFLAINWILVFLVAWELVELVRGIWRFVIA